MNEKSEGWSPRFFHSFSILRLPFLIQYTVNTEGARSGNGQQQVTARNGQVLHEHQGVHAFRKVAMEQERGQQRKARSEQRGGEGTQKEPPARRRPQGG